MNRFEILYEAIGTYSREADEGSTLHSAKWALDELYDMVRKVGFIIDDPFDMEAIRERIVTIVFDMLVIANQKGECGACLCQKLEDRLRTVLSEQNDIRMFVPPPTVINVSNPLPPGVSEGLEADIQKISEQGPGGGDE